MLEIMEKYLQKIDWNEESSLDYFHEIYQLGVLMTNQFISYMSMKDWFVWEPPKHLQDAQVRKPVYVHDALRKIFGDLIEEPAADGTQG
jgi:hypothetical protein